MAAGLGEPEPNHYRRESARNQHGVADLELAERVSRGQSLSLLRGRGRAPAAGLCRGRGPVHGQGMPALANRSTRNTHYKDHPE